MYRALLAAAVWVGITGAALVNQRLAFEYVPSHLAAAVSVGIWAVHGVIISVIMYLLAEGEPAGLRWRWSLSVAIPLVVQVWLLLLAVFAWRVAAEPFLVPALLISAAVLPVWRAPAGVVAYSMLGWCFVAALLSLIMPKFGNAALALTTAGYLALGWLCYMWSPPAATPDKGVSAELQ